MGNAKRHRPGRADLPFPCSILEQFPSNEIGANFHIESPGRIDSSHMTISDDLKRILISRSKLSKNEKMKKETNKQFFTPICRECCHEHAPKGMADPGHDKIAR
jgi:hypothetical protein